jgi:response regulator RpfG family c-di-GMP phosphodiesterase
MSSVLVVDDEAAMRNLMTRWVEMTGHCASTASNAEEALDVLAQEVPDVVVCDVKMPGHDGIWLAERIHHEFPDTAVIIATGSRETDPRVAEYTGAVDYILKPFSRDRLRFALDRGVDWHEAAASRREWIQRLSVELRARHDELADTLSNAGFRKSTVVETLLSLVGRMGAAAVDHAHRVGALALRIGEIMELPQEELVAIYRGALLHDFGKLALPEPILIKSAMLSLEEKELVRQYPAIGADLLHGIDGFGPVALIVGTAKESYDGCGYPQALSRDAIPLGGRIVSVADAFDTMTRTHSYRDAMPISDAVQEILRCSNSQFDPVVVSALLEALGRADTLA